MTLGICALVLEVRARIYSGALFNFETVQSRFHRLVKNKCGSSFDSWVGWKSDPRNSRLENIFGTQVTIEEPSVRSNGRGLRTPGNEQLRILVTGDSFTFGDEVSDSETWPSYLEEIIGARVYNAAGCGYDLTQMYLRLEELMRKVGATTAIVSITGPAIKRASYKNFESITQIYKPYFSHVGGKLSLQNVPVPYYEPEGLNESLFHDIFGRSHLADTVFRKLLPNYWVSPSKVKYQPAPSGEDPVDVSCKLMSKLYQLSKIHNVPIYVMGQYPFSEREIKSETIDEVLRCAQKKGLGVLELKHPLNEVRTRDFDRYRTFYMGEQSHMTPHGNRFIAEKVVEQLND